MLGELKQCFLEAYDDNQDGKIEIREVSHKYSKHFFPGHMITGHPRFQTLKVKLYEPLFSKMFNHIFNKTAELTVLNLLI